MKKSSFWNYVSKILALSLVGSVLLVTSCKEDEPPAPAKDAVASFQYAISETNFLEVTFTDFSQNATSWAWDFGDGNVAVEQSPTHTYAAAGDYTVSLTVKNADGKASAPFTSDITITDPNEALKLLTGEVSKTWKFYRVGTSASLGPNANNPAGWWAGVSNDGSRPCLYNQTFTYHLDGTFVFDDMGMFWGENDPFSGTAQHEICFVPSASTMINKDGADVSAWGSGTHAFEYDPSTGKVTLNGLGAWMGFVHTIGLPDKYSHVPTSTRSFNIDIVEETGYDLMTLTYDYGDADAGGDGLWTAMYVSYSDTSLEPALVDEPAGCNPLTVQSPTELSRTFASDAGDQYVLIDTIASGSGIVYGADDPDNASGTKVGKFIRNAGVDYQELQLQISPEANDINFENITTVSMDVYLPSTNDYSGDLTDKVIIGLGETTCPPDWWTDNIEYSTDAVAKDTWVTLTYDITAPSFVAKPENGASPKERNDLDMIYINIGGGGHQVGAEFYIRNLKFE